MASIKESTNPASRLVNRQFSNITKGTASNHGISCISGNADNECIETSAISSCMDDMIGLGKLFAPLPGNWHRIIGLIQ